MYDFVFWIDDVNATHFILALGSFQYNSDSSPNITTYFVWLRYFLWTFLKSTVHTHFEFRINVYVSHIYNTKHIYVFCNAESCVCALMTTLAVNLNEFLLFHINTCTSIIVYSHILEHIIVEAPTIHLQFSHKIVWMRPCSDCFVWLHASWMIHTFKFEFDKIYICISKPSHYQMSRYIIHSIILKSWWWIKYER